MKNPRLALGATTAVAVLVTGTYLSSAAATPASTGDLAPVQTDVVSGELAGTENGPATVSQDGVRLRTTTPTTVTTFELTYPVGSFSGWHSHPGIVVAVVEEGSVTRRTKCRSEVFTAGQSFTETGPHHVSNAGDVPAVLSITRIYPTDGGPGRVDEPEPRCS